MKCDDKNPCTIDHLVYLTPTKRTCVHQPVSCNDQNKCTIDHCDQTVGCTYQPVECSDNFLCTTETCNPAHGCQRLWKSCDDGDRCTVDLCASSTGECYHTALDCDDDDPCTLDSCQPLKGCVHAPGGCEPPESPNFENLTTSVLAMLVHDPEDPTQILAPCQQKAVLLGGVYAEVPAGFEQLAAFDAPVVGVALCYDPYLSTCNDEPAPLKQTAGFVFVNQPIDWLAQWSAVDAFGTTLGDVYAKDNDATAPYYFPGVEFPGVDAQGVPAGCTYSFAVYICPEVLKPYSCQ